jgi:hypothetical protein
MRRTSSYFHKGGIHPVFVSLLIIAGGLALFFLVRAIFFNDTGTLAETELHIPAGNTVYVQIENNDKFQSMSANSLRILENESIQSRNTANSYLQFFENSRIYLNDTTQVTLLKSREHKGEAREILVKLNEGQIWIQVSPSLNPRSRFTVEVFADVSLETKNGHFSVNTEVPTVKVAQGTVRVVKYDNGEEVFFQDIGVGQEFSLQGDIEQNSLMILTEDEWFTARKQALAAETSPADDEQSDDDDTAEEEPAPNLQGLKIIIPGQNGETVLISQSRQEISGTVPVGTASVAVDDYKLQKFTAGDTRFSYIADTQYDNLQEGKNTYVIKAFDVDGSVISEGTITVNYDPEGDFTAEDAATSEEESADTSDESATAETQEEVTEEFAITGPNDGNDFVAEDTQGVDITGTAPSNALAIQVDDYKLSRFTPGDETWVYRVRKEYDNMQPGENVYEVKALGIDDKILGQSFIKITFPEFETTASQESESSSETEITPEPSGTETTEG